MTTKKLDAALTSPYSLSKTTGRRKRGSKRIRNLVYADFVVIMIVLFGSIFVRFGTEWPKNFSTYLVGFLVASALHLLIYYFGELYDAAPRIGAKLWFPRVTALTSIAICLRRLLL